MREQDSRMRPVDAYYEFLCDIVDHFDEKYDDFIEKLQYALAEGTQKRGHLRFHIQEMRT